MLKYLTGPAAYAGLTVLCLVQYVPGLMTLPPLDRDEARFAQATFQMTESRDFIRIRFQDELRYKKPIGIHWLQAAAVETIGRSCPNRIWLYRIPSTLGAMLAVLLIYFFGRRLFSRQEALLAAALLASSLLLVAEAHLATTDAALLAAIVAAQGALGLTYLEWRRGEKARTVTALVFWTAQGVGILLKGPVTPLCSLLTIGALVIADRHARWIGGLRFSLGLPLVALIVGPWTIAISRASGAAFWKAIGSDLLPKLVSEQESHGFPPGYYLLLLMVTFWPGSLFAAPGLIRGWKNRSTAAERFCLAWIIPTWLVFELIPTKLPHYILPVFPALALLVSRAVWAQDGQPLPETGKLAGFGFVSWLGVALALGLGILLLPWMLSGRFDPPTAWPAAAAVSGGVWAARNAFRGRLLRACTIGLAASALTLAPVLHWILPRSDALWLSRKISLSLQQQIKQTGRTASVIAAGYCEPSLVFSLGTGLKLATSPAEAAQFLSRQPDRIAIISAYANAEFLKTLAQLNQRVEIRDTIRGFNYTKGRWETLRLYARPALAGTSCISDDKVLDQNLTSAQYPTGSLHR